MAGALSTARHVPYGEHGAKGVQQDWKWLACSNAQGSRVHHDLIAQGLVQRQKLQGPFPPFHRNLRLKIKTKRRPALVRIVFDDSSPASAVSNVVSYTGGKTGVKTGCVFSGSGSTTDD